MPAASRNVITDLAGTARTAPLPVLVIAGAGAAGGPRCAAKGARSRTVGVLLFGVPIFGSLALLALLSTLFITTNLSIGYTFSTILRNQLQAMQMSMMFFLPNILLSGFMFPFAGMPSWA